MTTPKFSARHSEGGLHQPPSSTDKIQDRNVPDLNRGREPHELTTATSRGHIRRNGNTNAISPQRVATEVAIYTRAREELLQAFGELDEETLVDTLEGISDLREVLTEVLRSALADEVLAAALTERLTDMKVRLARFHTRADKKRDLVRRAMTEVGLKQLVAPEFTACLRQGAPNLDISDERKIPLVYWKPQPAKLDRQSLLAALKGGALVEGAELRPASCQLTVRTK